MGICVLVTLATFLEHYYTTVMMRSSRLLFVHLEVLPVCQCQMCRACTASCTLSTRPRCPLSCRSTNIRVLSTLLCRNGGSNLQFFQLSSADLRLVSAYLHHSKVSETDLRSLGHLNSAALPHLHLAVLRQLVLTMHTSTRKSWRVRTMNIWRA
jgi:hypothetical protein